MHELGITGSIVNIVLDKAKEAQASKITDISLVVGELSGFVPDCIEFYFDVLSKDTIAQGATLHFELVPAQVHCRTCLTTFSPQDTQWVCPKCHGLNVEVVGGRELYVKNMEVE
jgi:hydrogenase nickel incorporation protein HypA/HybF